MIALNALPLDKWTVEDLAGMERERAVEIERLDVELKSVRGELARRHKDAIAAAFKKADKDHGKVTLDIATTDNFRASLDVEIRQTVEWDQSKLLYAGDGMTKDEAQHIFTTKLSVGEKIYNALPPGDLKTKLTAARTTKLSAPSVKVKFPN